MSITKTQETPYTDGDQTVKYKLKDFRVNGLNHKATASIWCELAGFIGDATVQADSAETTVHVSDMITDMTTAEKQAAKAFIIALERIAKDQIKALKDETYDDSDAF